MDGASLYRGDVSIWDPGLLGAGTRGRERVLVSGSDLPYREDGDVRALARGGFAEAHEGVIFVYLLLGVAVTL